MLGNCHKLQFIYAKTSQRCTY